MSRLDYIQCGSIGVDTHLSPTTFNATIGTRPLQMLMSKVNLSGKTRIVSEITNNMTAIMSWVRRKKSGAAVVLRTHLLLIYSRVSS
jgi:hypothetical protein